MSRSALFAVLAFGSVTLGGCAGSGGGIWLAPVEPSSPMYSAVSPSAAASREVLDGARVCCESLAGLRFEPLDLRSPRFFPIDERSQAFQFATGKSLVQGLAIPADLERATLDLDSVAGATVFAPTVLILDRDFQISRAMDSGSFKYAPAGFMEPQRLHGRIHLDRSPGSKLKDEQYLVVLTTDKDLEGSTTLISEARLYARSRGLTDPRVPGPVAEHAATGALRVRLSDLESPAPSAATQARQKRRASRYLVSSDSPATAVEPSKTRPTPSTAAMPADSPVQPMSPKTQAIYDRMIRQSVASGDLDRAWRLVLEAERAGSTGARQTFVEAANRK